MTKRQPTPLVLSRMQRVMRYHDLNPLNSSRTMRFGFALIRNGRPPESQRETVSNSGWPQKKKFRDIIGQGPGSGGHTSGPGLCRHGCGFSSDREAWHRPESFKEGQTMRRTLPFEFSLRRLPRFVSFDAGVVAALLGIGIYLAILNRHWIAAAFLGLGVLWMISIPIRLRAGKSNGR